MVNEEWGMESEESEMGNGEWENKMKNWKFFSKFFFLRFTVYNEEHIFFIDIRVLFQKRSVTKYPRISPGFKRGIFVNVTRLDQSRASKIFDGL